MKNFLIFLLILNSIISINTYIFNNNKVFLKRNSKNIHSSTLYQSNSNTLVVNSDNDIIQEKLRKWFLLNYKVRPEVYFTSVNDLPTLMNVISESILLSLRVLQKDSDTSDFVSLHVLNDLNNFENTLLNTIASSVQGYLNESSPIFQPNFQRSVKFYPIPTDFTDKAKFMLAIETRRIQDDLADFDDLNEFVPSPDFDKIETNDIEAFPFPTVFDFISEINRPPDPFTMSELRFKYGIQDLKYDLEKMKKKKNPQEVVDGINCKLTRLAKWREILKNEVNSGMPDPDTNLVEWADKVRSKYKSLLSVAKFDPKRALDTQYDKRQTFIKIIDQWSDRLKRNFKFIYQSQRVPEDFNAPIMRSVWRNEVINTTRILMKSLFLDLEGPEFNPGSPSPLFDPNRVMIWDANYPVEIALYEMVTWAEVVDGALSVAEGNKKYYNSITQHTYSRGFVTERVLTDAWSGLSKWLNSLKSTSSGNSLSSSKLAAELSVNGEYRTKKREDIKDHTTKFLDTLKSINSIARENSKQQSKSVKEFFREYYNEGKILSEWWTTLVRDFDLVDEMEKTAENRNVPWSEIMNSVIEVNANKERPSEDGIDAKQTAIAAEQNLQLWNSRYGSVMKFSEEIETYLPWKKEVQENYKSESIEALKKTVKFDEETVHLEFSPENSSEKSFLFVAPRYFRGIGLDEELSAFFEFCGIFSALVERFQPYLGESKIEVIPLHPLMINANGAQDYSRRSPHPALLFKIKN